MKVIKCQIIDFSGLSLVTVNCIMCEAGLNDVKPADETQTNTVTSCPCLVWANTHTHTYTQSGGQAVWRAQITLSTQTGCSARVSLQGEQILTLLPWEGHANSSTEQILERIGFWPKYNIESLLRLLFSGFWRKQEKNELTLNLWTVVYIIIKDFCFE